MTSSPIFSFSLCFFFLFLFALTVESSLFSFPSSTPLSVSLLAGGSKKGTNTVNTTTNLRFHCCKELVIRLHVFLDFVKRKSKESDSIKKKEKEKKRGIDRKEENIFELFLDYGAADAVITY